MLRLYSHIFAVWVAVVFALLAADLLGAWHAHSWFIGATAAAAIAVVLGLNILNPEAVVVSLNIDHERSTHKIDADYLASLSSDATPGLADAHIRAPVCSGQRRTPRPSPRSTGRISKRLPPVAPPAE